MVEDLAEARGLRLDYGFSLCDASRYDEVLRDWGQEPPEVEGSLLGVYDAATKELLGMLLMLYGDFVAHRFRDPTYARFLPLKG